MPSCCNGRKALCDKNSQETFLSKKGNILLKDTLTKSEGPFMTKHTKKDGGTKQNSKHKPKNKTSGSANGQNGYH